MCLQFLVTPDYTNVYVMLKRSFFFFGRWPVFSERASWHCRLKVTFWAEICNTESRLLLNARGPYAWGRQHGGAASCKDLIFLLSAVSVLLAFPVFTAKLGTSNCQLCWFFYDMDLTMNWTETEHISCTPQMAVDTLELQWQSKWKQRWREGRGAVQHGDRGGRGDMSVWANESGVLPNEQQAGASF